MRGSDERTGALFSYVDLEARVPAGHPLRAIRSLVNEALSVMGSDLSALYSGLGRPSIAPEKLLRAMLLQAFYSIRSERQLMERLEFDLLFRWFVGLGIDDAVWDHSTFSKNRDRLLAGDVAAQFLSTVLAGRRVKRLLSSEHFSVDGTLIQAWASMTSFRPVEEPGRGSGPNEPPPASGGRNAEADFRCEKRSNATHASTTDPDAKLYRKGPGMEARLAFLGHRRSHHPPSRLCRKPAHPQAHRGGPRLDEGGGRALQAQAARRRPGRMGLHLRRRSLQPRPPAEAVGDAGMSEITDAAPATIIVEAARRPAPKPTTLIALTRRPRSSESRR
jgi:transposase